MGHLWRERSRGGGKMMKMPDAIPVFSFHFSNFAFCSGVRKVAILALVSAIRSIARLGRLAMNRFHVGAGLFDQGSYLRHLFISQIQTGSQMSEHVAGHLLRIGQSHERTPDHRGD